MRPATNRSVVLSASKRRFQVFLVLLGLIALSIVGTGCGGGLGETAAEASRRRERIVQINLREMITDIDRVLMLDEPSRLTERDLP
ncbi:MAG: hypothetical protein QHH07_11530 [Sedimentisphaerales bacterium]|nr:hypothetical protein [Sedimentisphaerales bacterium]